MKHQPPTHPRRNLPAPIIISSNLDVDGASQQFSPRSAVSAASSLPLPSPASLTARWSVTRKLFPYFSDWTTAPSPLPSSSNTTVPGAAAATTAGANTNTDTPLQYIHDPSSSYTLPRQPATRLWNPQNSSPRSFASATFTKYVVEPIRSPPAGSAAVSREEEEREHRSLLTTGERRRSRSNLLQASRVDSQVDLRAYPVSHRDSSDYCSERSSVGVPAAKQRATVQTLGHNNNNTRHTHRNTQAITPPVPRANMPSPALAAVFTPSANGHSKDIERQQPGVNAAISPSPSRASLPHSSHNDTHRPPTITTEPTIAEEEYPWGPSHPCFPHQNSHVPLASPLHASTRIIRVRRDWMQAGDLAPTFANLYPEVLDPLVSEEEFRRVIRHVNAALIAAFSPWSFRNWLDGVLGVLTLWLWDDLGLSGVKRRLRELELWIEHWNKTVGLQEGVSIVPLRRTGYLSLDIQIPDPHITLDPLVYGPSRPDTAHDPALHPGFGEPGPYPVPRVPANGSI